MYPPSVKPTMKRHVSQTTDLSEPEVSASTVQQPTAVISPAVPSYRPPANPTVVEHPATAPGLPEFQDTINNSRNAKVLSAASTIEM